MKDQLELFSTSFSQPENDWQQDSQGYDPYWDTLQPSIDEVKKDILKLNKTTQQQLLTWLEDLLSDPLPEPPSNPKREVVERHYRASICYQLEKVICGKGNCKCANGKKHGPYWYSYQWNAGRVVSKYIGKASPIQHP